MNCFIVWRRQSCRDTDALHCLAGAFLLFVRPREESTSVARYTDHDHACGTDVREEMDAHCSRCFAMSRPGILAQPMGSSTGTATGTSRCLYCLLRNIILVRCLSTVFYVLSPYWSHVTCFLESSWRATVVKSRLAVIGLWVVSFCARSCPSEAR